LRAVSISMRLVRHVHVASMEAMMAKTMWQAVAAAVLALSGSGAVAESYAKMAPLDAYMMDRAAEIALAKSAAPAAISDHATVLVLTRSGAYETAATGTNGFVCLVERGFSGAPDWNERWNPKVRAAGCLNPAAVQSILPIDRLRTRLTIEGQSDEAVWAAIKAQLASGAIPPLAAGAMCYMMSKQAYLSDLGTHVMGHVMFYTASKDGAEWGANAKGSPVMGGNYWWFLPEHAADAASLPPVAVLLIPTATFSDGSMQPMMGM
jgi:hypothetical protein